MSLDPAALAMSGAGPKALRVFFRIAETWGLADAEQMTLLGIDEQTLLEWQAGNVGALGVATLERLSHVFSIYSSLHQLLPIPERANAWIKLPNTAPLFGGSSALDRMLRGQASDLLVVRQYLDSQLAG